MAMAKVPRCIPFIYGINDKVINNLTCVEVANISKALHFP
jgi:hypothetical protein